MFRNRLAQVESGYDPRTNSLAKAPKLKNILKLKCLDVFVGPVPVSWKQNEVDTVHWKFFISFKVYIVVIPDSLLHITISYNFEIKKKISRLYFYAWLLFFPVKYNHNKWLGFQLAYIYIYIYIYIYGLETKVERFCCWEARFQALTQWLVKMNFQTECLKKVNCRTRSERFGCFIS